MVTDTISLYGLVCPDAGRAGTVVYTRNAALPDPAPGCRPAAGGEQTVVVADPADLDRVYDRVRTGAGGYASAVVPVGEPFVLLIERESAGLTMRDASPIYLLPVDRERRQPISVRVFQLVEPVQPGPVATPTDDGTPTAGTASAQPITLLGVVCASDSLAGTYAYLPGLDAPAVGAGGCRRATVGEMEFLLLDNAEPNRLYDDALSETDGTAIAWAPVGRAFFVAEFSDDPAPETGLAEGSPAITIPADPAARQPVALTVIRYVAPGAVELSAGTLFLSSVACPPANTDASITVLGPDPAILVTPPDATPAAVPQPGATPAAVQPGSGRGCDEANGDYQIAPYGNPAGTPIAVTDGAADGALVARLPATITADGARAFEPYRITEVVSGATATFDIQEGRFTAIRVVLTDAPATPVAGDGASGRPTAGAGDPATDRTPAVTSGASTAVTTATVPGTPDVSPSASDGGSAAGGESDDPGGPGYSPVRLLWATLALLAIAVFLAGVWVLRRPRLRAGGGRAVPRRR